MDMEKSPKICIVGAGFAGLCMAVKLKTELGIHSFTVFEANEEVGGVWHSNTYPGCSCDTTSQLYSFSFEPNYDWSSGCASQPELLDYLKGVAKKHELYANLRFNTKVESLRWNDKEQKWHANILDIKRRLRKTEEFDIVIGATGKVRLPHYPEEYLSFKGPIIHTAKWDPTVPLEGKRVAVIGSQASAVQVTAAIASKVKKLTLFQREAPHIIPRFWQWKFSSIARWAFLKLPLFRFFIRLFWFWLLELFFYPATRNGSLPNKMLNAFANFYKTWKIKDPGLLDKITPKNPMLCKRMVMHESYYDALNLPNVEVITDRIKSVSGTVLRTKNRDFEVDVLILATGFQQSEFFAPMKIYSDGLDIPKLWKEERPQGFLGIVYSSIPNYFNILGPYTEIAHTSNIFNVECQVNWVILAVKELLRRKKKCLRIRKEAEMEFMKRIDKDLEKSVWKVGNNCESWYFDKQGRNVMIWPGSQIEFWWITRTFKPEMFYFN